MYVLRSKVSLKLLEDAFISVGFMGGKVFAGGKIKTPKNHLDIVKYHDIMIIRIGQKDGRYQLMGEASKAIEFIKLNFSSYSTMSLDDWNNLNIMDGIPEIYPTTQETLIPQSLNLDLIEGINFKKGLLS